MSAKIPVKDYISSHNLSAVVEEALNALYKAQSSNPAAFLSSYFASKIEGANKIDKIHAREIIDSRGNPTVEVDVYVAGKLIARASAPSGASTGSNEARELRDGDKSRYLGKGTLTACKNVDQRLSPALAGQDVTNQRAVDQVMRDVDGTELKENIGGNAITAASFALAEAGAAVKGTELFLHFADTFYGADKLPAKYFLPTPLVNILNGGKHAGGKLKIQEFMIVPRRDQTFAEALRSVTQVYHHLGKILAERYGLSAKNLGDEGGYAPSLQSPAEALDAIEAAVKAAGFELGHDIKLSMDCAASEFYDEEKRVYEIEEGMFLSTDEVIDYYGRLLDAHPHFFSIEDPLHEKDYDGWKKFTERFGSRIKVIGDDLYTTNPRFIRQGVAEKWANALLLKVNQIGTITESMEAAKLKFDNDMIVVVSHRSGETGTTLIADLVVGIGATAIKTGATARGERVGKYNRLLEIEEYLREHDKLGSYTTAW